MEVWTLALLFAVAVALVVWWLRGLSWDRGPDQEAPSSWEAARRFDDAGRRLETERLRMEDGHGRVRIDDAERLRLRVEVARLEDENRDLRAMLPTDDYRTVSRRGSR